MGSLTLFNVSGHLSRSFPGGKAAFFRAMKKTPAAGAADAMQKRISLKMSSERRAAFPAVVERGVDDVHGARDDGQLLLRAGPQVVVDELVEPVDDLLDELRALVREGDPDVSAVIRVS